MRGPTSEIEQHSEWTYREADRLLGTRRSLLGPYRRQHFLGIAARESTQVVRNPQPLVQPRKTLPDLSINERVELWLLLQ